MQDRIYLGIHRHVLCLDKHTGREIWRTALKRSHLVTVMVAGDMVLAHAGGTLFGLRLGDGAILWQNDLPGLGYGYCTLASDAAAQQAQQAQAAAVAAAAATTAASAS